MNAWLRVALIGAISVVVFDIVLSIASIALDFNYANGSFGSWLLYGGVGFFAARATGMVRHGAAASAIVGVTDATLGWWVSALLGPGRLPASVPEMATPQLLVFTVGFVAATAAIIGALGGLLSRVTSAPGPEAPAA